MKPHDINQRSAFIEAQLIQHLIALDHVSPLKVIGLYLPLRDEPKWDFSRWKHFPWKLAFPSPKADGMHFVVPSNALPDRGHWIEEGTICEPDLVVVPGLVFSVQGFRVGRGGGFYDRLFGSWRPARGCIGVCFEEQLRNEFEIEAHDMRMDLIMTEARLINCQS